MMRALARENSSQVKEMQPYSGIIWCSAWIVGLLSTQIPYGLWIASIAFAGLGFALHRWKPIVFQVKPFLVGSVLVGVAVGYCHWRTPQPQVDDISQYISALDRQVVNVTGTVEALPRTTRSGKTQFWFQVKALDAGELNARLTRSPQNARGRLYVTIADRRLDFPPGTQVTLTGTLYRPKPRQNPGGFDFQRYLAMEGCFAGLSATEFDRVQVPQGWGLWQVQRRITQTMLVGLPQDEGLLLAAMVLGNKAVDVPSEMQDAFTKVGLSHALAASGFQVSLMIAVVLALTDRAHKWIQVAAGGLAILLLLGLTGVQPAILRAGVMGFAVLGAIAVDRKIKPVSSLLFSCVVLLIYNPLWIWNLGFQLSALATLGLLVTVPALQPKLDWLPTALAAAIATSIAAYLWTLPLQLYSLGLVTPYSILVNVLTTVFISVISLGGMVTAIVAVAMPSLGSLCAGLLHFPIVALLSIVKFAGTLPGNQWATGTISIAVLVSLYGLGIFLTLRHEGKLMLKPVPRSWEWGLASVFAIALIFAPAALSQGQTRITALVSKGQPILVAQSQGKVLLVNTGDRATVDNTLISFLHKQGINKVDRLLHLHPANAEAVRQLRDRIPIGFSLTMEELGDQALTLGDLTFQGDRADQTIELRQSGQPTWILCRTLSKGLRQELMDRDDRRVLWWSGAQWSFGTTTVPKQIQGAIAYGRQMNPELEAKLQQLKVPTFELAQDGAVQWVGDRGFSTTFSKEATEFARL